MPSVPPEDGATTDPAAWVRAIFDVRSTPLWVRAAHLDFRCAVGFDGAARLVRVTTVVRLHGWKGRAYFVPVRLAHGPVLTAMLRRAARRLGRPRPRCRGRPSARRGADRHPPR
ncbi:DUF2867 domain-containing protein [Oerskovia paurometabola]|uniref:DUF2867 domain-containing protein n=1 Tax=Oerskovia paurometabola TaxID=162170 RepID=UPI0034311AAF